MVIINLFSIVWFSLSAFVAILGILVIFFPHFVPRKIVNLFLFGKFSNTSGPQLNQLYEFNLRDIISSIIRFENTQVPKSWFLHFYVFALIYHSLLFKLFWFLWVQERCTTLRTLLDILFGRKASYSKANSPNLIAVIYALAIIHFCRRGYEVAFVNIFSHSTINVFHYAMGYAFYASFGLVLLNLLVPVRYAIPADVSYTLVTIGFTLYVIGSLIQNRSFVALRNLRKRKDGANNVNISYEHFIPKGLLFEFLSSPQYVSEIMIYFSFYLMSNCDSSWHGLLSWVIVSQTLSSILAHRWYVNKFGDRYPKRRKAIIPFIF